MSPKATAPTTPACSFCGKEAAAVSKIIAGPGIFICDECVGLCNEILAGAAEESADDAEPARSVPHWAAMTDEQILDHLPKVARVSAQVDAGVQAMVDLLRERGVAWARIGAALGVARQTAWEKYAAAE